MDEGQTQGEEPVRRGQGGDISGVVDLLYNHDGHLRSVSSSVSGQLSPDENRNRLMEEGEEVEQGPRGGSSSQLRQQQQDSVNNNGSCEEEEEVEEEEDSSKVEVEDEEEEEVEEEMEGDSNSGAFSPDLDSQIRDSSSGSPTGVEELVSSPEECPLGRGVEDQAEEGDALRSRGDHLPYSPPAAALDLGEPWDHALLPQRLHQIAEALVLEEDYERAIRFIQLERLYHERLLANLATLQEQWEHRWRGSGRGQRPTAEWTPIDPDQLDRLSQICRTHRQPSLRAEQSETADKVQKNSLIGRQTRAQEEEKERSSTALLPCGTGSGADSTRVTMEQEKDTQERESSRHYTDFTESSSALGHQMASESSQSQPSPHPPTETLISSSGLTDSPPSNSFAPEGRVEVVLSAAAAAVVEAVLAGETERDGRPAEDIPEAPAVAAPVAAATDASRSASREGPGEEERQALPPPQQQHQEPHTQPHTQPSVSQHMEPTHGTHTPDEPLSHTTTATTTASSVSLTQQKQQQQQPKAGAELLGSSQSEERTAGDGEEEDELEEEEEEEVEEEEEEEEVEEAEEALELEEGGGGGGGGDGDGELVDLDVPEEIPEYEDARERNQVVAVETLEPVKVATLDDMAKRIQVEEITPASGLVSILKRRASLEGTSPSRPTPKPKALTKRKVRFREPDDGFDQDEVSGDSWVLLLLLCLATVVISVGGTALYCTVGDAQSSVCTDFSHNMDFYVGQVQRGMAELKHWFSPSS